MSSELEDILAAFSRLVAAHEASREGGPEEEDPENFRCVDCVDCVACRFCTSCERCSNCTYCDACSDCADCTQSRECIACAECSQSNLSAYCEKSSYLTLCLDCDTCVHCFACVGLSGAEFHILNEPYKRSAYFKKVTALRKLLDVKLTEGWTPPWALEHEVAEQEADELDAAEQEAAEQEVAEQDAAEPGEPEPEPLPPPPEYRVVAPGEPMPDSENTLTPAPDPSTSVGERGAPRRVDPYTDRTSRLPDIPVAVEATGSWPPSNARVARSMDREAAGKEPWEELFEPDELPPPRPRAQRPGPATQESEPPRNAPRPGRFDRLVTPKARDSEHAPPAESSSSVTGRGLGTSADPESTGSLRRAKRPLRR